MTRVFRGFLLVAGILVLLAAPAYGQATGSIFGKVTDSSGGVLPGVTVTVTGATLQQPLVTTTQTSGAYQFPLVPIGTFTVTFELASFKKAARQNVVIETGFNAEINQQLEVGQLSEEMTVTAATPVVDTKKTATGATFSKDVLENIPTARDPWQIINMAPGVQAGLNVGGSASGQQVGLSIYGTGANVQWNLEGGSITDLSSNSSPSYYNFDSFEQIQVVTGGGDVSVQSSGLSINLVTKSGSNVFKGTALGTFQNDATQGNNVDEELFSRGAGGLLSGAPINKITNASIEYGGPILRNRLWWWAAAGHQNINVGVLNFFDVSKGPACQAFADAQRTGSLGQAVTYDNLDDVQDCLFNDKTTIKNLSWKFNYQLNASNKLQYLYQGDNKIRNSRGASSSTAKEATTRQYAEEPWGLPSPTNSLTHTWIASDRLVFNNQYTSVHGGFFLDYQDYDSCGESRYNGSADGADYARNSSCLWNQQQLTNRTTAFRERSLQNSYQTVRHSHELKTDGTYFATNLLGGDHSLKFGVGYRKNPIMSFVHYSGGARAFYQCVGNQAANCGAGNIVAPGTSATGIVPYRAELNRDILLNNDWWSYNGYLQDSYSRGRLRINGGLRYDWQTSEYLGGCVPANEIRPDLLPSQCDPATNMSTVPDPETGEPVVGADGQPIMKKIPSFSVWSPRVSATYDLRGDGKTNVHASYSLYYETKVTLADSLGGLAEDTTLTWGSNASSGNCSTTARSCWTDANRDGLVQSNELIGTPTAASSQFDPATGQLLPVGNAVTEDAKLARTREAIVGVQQELFPNIAVGIDYIYRNYDRGLANYSATYQPGGSNFPLSAIYSGPLTHTDPVTGISAPYYVVCSTCQRPTGGFVTMTSLAYETYHGVNLTVNKRFNDRWQLNGALTVQTNRDYRPIGSFTNPTGIEFTVDTSEVPRYLFKLNGSYQMGWGITASGNLNWNDGDIRTRTITGPGNVFGGVGQSTINYGTLNYQARDTERFDSTALLDAGVQKVFTFGGGRYRVKAMFDGFNLLNIATILNYTSQNASLASSTQVSSVVPPRVFRFGAQISF